MEIQNCIQGKIYTFQYSNYNWYVEFDKISGVYFNIKGYFRVDIEEKEKPYVEMEYSGGWGELSKVEFLREATPTELQWYQKCKEANAYVEPLKEIYYEIY